MSSQVSVVIPSYNCANYLRAALESVLAQSYRPFEIIVIDDGSTDETQELIRDYPQVIYVRQENSGPSRARNTGVRRAQGRYIAFLDADDIWTSGKLSAQMAIMESHPEVGIVFGDMQNFFADDAPQQPVFQKYKLTEEFFGHPSLVMDPVAKLLRINFIATGTVLARKDILESCGLFDEQVHAAEDWDLWLRIALRHPIAYTASVVMLRRRHDTNTSKNTEAMSSSALQVLEKLQCERADELARASVDINKHLEEGYTNLGYFYLRQMALGQARQALWKSFSFGIQGRAVLYFLSTFLGRAVVGSIMRARG